MVSDMAVRFESRWAGSVLNKRCSRTYPEEKGFIDLALNGPSRYNLLTHRLSSR